LVSSQNKKGEQGFDPKAEKKKERSITAEGRRKNSSLPRVGEIPTLAVQREGRSRKERRRLKRAHRKGVLGQS